MCTSGRDYNEVRHSGSELFCDTQKTAYELKYDVVDSEICKRDGRRASRRTAGRRARAGLCASGPSLGS